MLNQLRIILSGTVVDAVVVAGDLAVPRMAGNAIQEFRSVVGDLPLAVCLGNHDFWLERGEANDSRTLDDIRDRYWVGPCRESDVVLLDRENLELSEAVVVGGYGHFDLGMAVEGLKIDGRLVTREDYLRGGWGRTSWNDFIMIPNCAERVDQESTNEADGLRDRLLIAGRRGPRLVAAMHTIPWMGLNGHPQRQGERDIFHAYSGNTKVGAVLEEHADQIDLVVCGHTHRKVAERPMGGIPLCLNIGTDYGMLRGVVFDTASGSVEWVGCK